MQGDVRAAGGHRDPADHRHRDQRGGADDALLAAFETLLIYKLWIATRDAGAPATAPPGNLADRLGAGLGAQLEGAGASVELK